MQTTEIARKEWMTMLEQFSTAHEGWLVSLDLLIPDLGVQREFEDLPLLSISADHGPDGAIHLSAEQPHGELITHAVSHPSHVYVDRTDDGADHSLMIEDVSGTKAILKIRSAALPETVDGVARSSSSAVRANKPGA